MIMDGYGHVYLLLWLCFCITLHVVKERNVESNMDRINTFSTILLLILEDFASGLHLSGNNRWSRSFVFTDSSLSIFSSGCTCQYTHLLAATTASVLQQIKMERFRENEHQRPATEEREKVIEPPPLPWTTKWSPEQPIGVHKYSNKFLWCILSFILT